MVRRRTSYADRNQCAETSAQGQTRLESHCAHGLNYSLYAAYANADFLPHLDATLARPVVDVIQ
jgi:hypothetical protein